MVKVRIYKPYELEAILVGDGVRKRLNVTDYFVQNVMEIKIVC